ncbi:UDP-3-O-[3-hydroxymyristoyl] glucosamine N-acyltransferase [hydrothermal vent metagenome]|uniref:UDP-3-O-[3-hydroxymyristoyl] glucosamine N-acyltransferase n=1 Tax=hydrothermal vent metagenome TaxID=652676 RepID=A0A1W1EIE7_9ZZZZ
MNYKLSEIASILDIKFIGDDIIINSIHTLSKASSFTLSFFNSPKYINELKNTKAGAVLVSSQYSHLLPSSTIALITEEPYLKLALASKLFTHKISTASTPPKIGKNCDIDSSVVFGKNVEIGDSVTILANSYIGDNVKIGSNTLLYSNVSIYHNCTIGKNTIIHSGSVIGSDGYGFAHTKDAKHIKIYQNGNVIIENDVEIGANCSIDRGIFDATIISNGTKLDNLIHIAHNCIIGENSLLAGQVGLAGSTTTGRNIVMGGQSASAGHLHIGDFTTIAGKGGVTKSLKGNNTYAGFPAIEHKLWLKIQAKIARLIKKPSNYNSQSL